MDAAAWFSSRFKVLSEEINVLRPKAIAPEETIIISFFITSN